MESLLLEGRNVPFTDKVLIDREEMLEIIDQMRVSVPEDIREAQDILLSRDGIISKAEEDAGRIVREVESKVEARLRETEIIKEAEARAQQVISSARDTDERIRQEAERAAKAIRQQAERYCLDILKKLEEHLSRQLNTVQGGIKSLEGDYVVAKTGSAPGPAGDEQETGFRDRSVP